MTLALERCSLWPVSDWNVRILAPRRLAITLALVACAYATTAIMLFLPSAFQRITGFHGHDALVWIYVTYATVVGLCLSLVPRVSALRGLVVTYAAMGVAGAAAHAFITLAVFPDGYVKSGDRLWSSLLVLALANVVSGTAGLRLGLRFSLSDSMLGALGALLAAPAVVPLGVAVLFGFELVRAVALAMLSK